MAEVKNENQIPEPENTVTQTEEELTSAASIQSEKPKEAPDETPAPEEAQSAAEAQPADDAAHNALQKAEKEAEEKAADAEGEAPDVDALKAQALSAELRAAAALAGVPAAKIPHLVRMADLAGAKEAKDLAAFAAAQVQAILKDVPELGAQAAGTGSAGNHARQDGAKDPETDAIIKGFDQRY